MALLKDAPNSQPVDLYPTSVAREPPCVFAFNDSQVMFHFLRGSVQFALQGTRTNADG